MENSKKISIKKGILIFIYMISMTILGLAIVLGALVLWGTQGDVKSLANNKSYVNSSAMKSTLAEEIVNIENYLELKEKFETKGKFDEEIMINAFEFSTDTHIPGQDNDFLKYRLGDLLNWRNQAVDYKSIQLDNTSAEEQKKLLDIEELYEPEGYSSIKEYAKVNKSNEVQCYQALVQTLDNIKSEVDQYYYYEEYYQNGKTNIRYVAENLKTDTQFSNVLDLKNMSQKITETIGDYQIEVWLDTGFPVKDHYYDVNNRYNKYVLFYPLIMVGLIIGSLGSIVTMIWLTILAGRKKTEDKIELLFIDKVPVEIAIILWGMLGMGILFIMIDNLSSFFYDFSFPYIVFQGAIIFLGSGLFLTGYLSLVRMIKAKIIKKNSITNQLQKNIVFIFQNINSTVKVVGAFSLYLAINFLLSIDNWWSGVGLLIAIVFNVLIGVFIFKEVVIRKQILEGARTIAKGDLDYKIELTNTKNKGTNELVKVINQIGDGLQNAVDESMKNEKMKTDLITNVSHDIKTPLTSIINYVDLLKRENISDEKIRGYIDVLDNKSQRLKQLTEDLVEASKVSSGNITLELISLDFNELLQQMMGEFEDKFQDKDLEIVVNNAEQPMVVEADGRCMWRIVENVFSNVAKYAMPHTRMYVDLSEVEEYMEFTVKNVSEAALNIDADELTERFIRGDISRSTEGSGLGLSIAKSLTKAQHGDFEIYLDGDLFKVTIKFKLVTK